MGSIEDMMESRVMEEPEWPRCARCDLDMVERKDPKTGKVVREGGRALLECPWCHEVQIGPEPQRARRRYRVVRMLVVGSGFAGSAATLIFRQVLQDGPRGLTSLGFFVMMTLIGGVAVAVHFGLDAAALAMSARNKADARFTGWAYVVFWGAVVAMNVWLMARVGWPMMREGAKAAGPAAAGR